MTGDIGFVRILFFCYDYFLLGPGMRQVVGFQERVILGANVGRLIVTNGKLTRCESA